MNIVQINLSQNQGSTGKIAEQIGVLAKSKGHEVYIASGRHFNKTELHPIKIGGKFDVLWHVFISHFIDGDGKGSYLSTKRLVNQLSRINPDIIHLHVIHESYINYPILFKYLKEANIPVVWTFHDCWAFTGHCCHFDYIGCNKWKTVCKDCPAGKNFKKLEFFHTSKSNFEKKKRLFTSIKDMTIVPVSEWLSGLVSESFLAKYDVKVIKNGIDLNVFKPVDSNLREKLGWKEAFVVLGVANGWGKKKGFTDFVTIAKKNPTWRFVMIGLPKHLHDSVPDNILAIQFTKNQAELAEYYSMADVYLNPTYEDTYPTVNLEAIACGTPVVTYNTGGSPETIGNGTGYIVDKGDISGLEMSMIRIMSNTKSYYIKTCRRHAEMNFNCNDKFKEYIDLYEVVISNRNK